jgi:predicted RNA-binding Zn-ribbon protein involved in translation (DUF1610 family)
MIERIGRIESSSDSSGSRSPCISSPSDEDHPFITLYCSHCGHRLQVQLSCGNRTCPYCRKKWYGYHFGALKAHISTWPKVYCLTLTLKNIPDKQISRWHVTRLREAFSKLRYRLKPAILDGYYVIQATNCGAGWHLHMHVLYRGGYVAKAAISQAWCDITKGSYIVDMKLVERWQKALQYLLSDFRGESRIRAQDYETYNSLFRGSRLVQGFGVFSKIKLRVPYRCPDCGHCSWTFIEVLLGEKTRFRPKFYAEPPP